ncbi:unnamed protein product, partial [Polarella glacialis]
VIFTWNEGQSWYDFKVSQTPFEVDNIITEPNLTGTTFLMFGTREEGVGVLYYLKFDSLQFSACQGVWGADSVSSDYETWNPSDGAVRASDEKCLLGQQVTYTRRKRTSQCWNGEKFERPAVKKACSCTQADFACDVGFVRSVGSTECVFGGVDMMPERFAPTICQGTYGAAAYRKVPGDKCEGGWSPLPIEVPCPGPTFRGSVARWMLLLLFVGGILYFVSSRMGAKKPGVKSKGFGEFSANSRLSNISEALQSVLSGCCGLFGKFLARGTAYPGYEKVKGDEFDMSIGNHESLNDFLDEADYDDPRPPPYSGLDDKKSYAASSFHEEEKSSVVSGGARFASEAVPKLQAPSGYAPPGGGPQTFDMASDDQDLL